MKKKQPECDDPFKPSVALLVKLGSIATHADEMISSGGHAFDKIALEQGIADPEVKAWIAKMTEMGMMPVKRN